MGGADAGLQRKEKSGVEIEILKAGGIDYEKGLARFMGKKELYERVLRAFLSDTAMDRAQEAYSSGNLKALLACAHEMKGASGNTDMTELCRASCELVELLRAGEPGRNELRDVFGNFRSAYLTVRAAISDAG